MGRSGGIVVMWDKRYWRGEVVSTANQCLTIKFDGINQVLTWYLSAVYASCDTVTRRELWQELSNIKEIYSGPWVSCGDFNVTRYPNERSEGHIITGDMQEFTEWINAMEFVDPPLLGGSFTWRRGDGHSSASRIDRFLYSSQWDEAFTQIKQNLLPRIGSDHNPIMLDCGELNSNKSYFKFEQWWLRVDGFADKIKEWWLSFNINGTGSYILATKLKMLKQKLKEWRMTHRNDWKHKKEEILHQLAEMEKTQELRLLSEDELLQKVHLAMEFEEVAKQEEIAWRQRSRIQWLKKGDKNTKFFHRVATAHKRFNSIDTLVVEGNSISDPEDIKGEIINFYQKLYTEIEEWRPEFKLQGLETISEEERDWLQTHFEEAEVLKCIKSCASDKAPGPDGFPMCFFQSFWEVLKFDFMNAVNHFHEKHEFERRLNATYVVLIPKKPGATELRDFRPISLIGGVYKIFAKLLAERVKKVISKLVNKHQMAFIQGRQILDAALIASECVDTRIKGETPGIMCKLDIEKAYDHVNWDFLINILRQMGFGEKWLKWIGFCIKTVRFSILINGEPAGFFPSERGLRQGDPLSTFLFILAMEGLNSMIRVASQKKWLKGFKVGNQAGEDLQICQLLYADDTVIFCDAKAEQVCFIRIILVIFEAVSGLSVNWRKSSMFQVKEVANIQCLANILSCKIENLPTTYLGMPLGNNHKELEIWDGIVEKTEKKLATWKTQYLSLGGRITMINSVLDALPTYVMSLFPLPAKVEDRLDKLRRDFLWLGNKEGKSINLVKWQTAQLSKKSGGLGIKNLGLQNRCLLSKWLWRFGKEGQALWKDVIVSKYGQTDSWTSNTVTSTYGVSVWRSIRNLWPKLARNICYKVGEGTRILFWKDKWIGQNSLMEDFADLYSLCDNPEASIAEMWFQQGWNITLRRLLNDWEVDRVANLLQRLEDFPGLNTNPDAIRWKRESQPR
ncbi:hypothetical protein KY285_004543 [Solanum tuberosum]|nr:hypothetical protein KY285_004543 [Solanum tuberosum]